MSDAANQNEWVLISSPSSGCTARASSVLQRNVKLYGPLNSLDTDNVSSCWNSDGCPEEVQDSNQQQFLVIDFGRPVHVRQVRIQFQAGFAAQSCQAMVKTLERQQQSQQQQNPSPLWETVAQWELEDSHELQSFQVGDVHGGNDVVEVVVVVALKLIFEHLTDFYGRVTIYRLEVWGKEVACH